MVKGVNDHKSNKTVILVDCSFSAKKKPKDIENYALYCAKVVKLEEDGVIEADQNLLTGNIDTFETSTGKEILSVVPHFCECPDKDECHPIKTNVWHQYCKPVYDTTIIPILEYKNYLVDPQYVKLLHSHVNGLIRTWRLAVDECCNSMHRIWGYP
jgi:hypothetical protein